MRIFVLDRVHERHPELREEDVVTALHCFADNGTAPNFLINARECAFNPEFEEKNT